MKTTFTVFSLLLLATTASVAQEPLADDPPQVQPPELTLPDSNVLPGSGLPTVPDRAFRSGYAEDREQMVRRMIQERAAWKAMQRRQRLQAYKWIGYSPLRPGSAPPSLMSSAQTWSGYVWYGSVLVYHVP